VDVGRDGCLGWLLRVGGAEGSWWVLRVLERRGWGGWGYLGVCFCFFS
jgi:hypothetical protein